MLLPRHDQYIDIHTHTNWNFPHIFSVKSLVKPGEPETFQDINKAITVGLHPWYLNAVSDQDKLDIVRKAAQSPHVIGIGECGIDMKNEIPFDHQERIFLEHLLIAEECQKPLIIHCVKAYHHFQKLIVKTKPGIPWIFHGFNSNRQVADDLVDSGAFLSIGADLLKDNSNIRRIISSLPLDRLFLETDEWQQPVWKIYKELSTLIRKPENEIKHQLADNFIHCFRIQQD